MDSSIATDPRFKLLALRLKISRNETAGALFHVWLACYEQRRADMSKLEIDVAAEIDGFADALIAERLADNRNGRVAIHGAKKRIEFLKSQREKGRRGGQKSAESRADKSEANGQPNGSLHASGCAQAYTPAPDLSPAPAPDRPPKAPRGGARHKGWSQELEAALPVAEAVLERLSARAGVTYSPCKTHVRHVARLLREGFTEEQMRKVVWHRWLKWRDQPEMQQYLRPKTLFGPENFANYLPQAEAAWAEANREEHQPTQPAALLPFRSPDAETR